MLSASLIQLEYASKHWKSTFSYSTYTPASFAYRRGHSALGLALVARAAAYTALSTHGTCAICDPDESDAYLRVLRQDNSRLCSRLRATGRRLLQPPGHPRGHPRRVRPPLQYRGGGQPRRWVRPTPLPGPQPGHHQGNAPQHFHHPPPHSPRPLSIPPRHPPLVQRRPPLHHPVPHGRGSHGH